MHSCLCELYVKSLGLMPSGFNFLFRTRPHAWLQQTPPEPALIPYDVTRQQWVKMFWLHRFSGLHHPSIMLWCYNMMSLGRIELTIFCIHRFSGLHHPSIMLWCYNMMSLGHIELTIFCIHRFSGLHHPSIMLWCYMMSLGRIELTVFCIHRFSGLHHPSIMLWCYMMSLGRPHWFNNILHPQVLSPLSCRRPSRSPACHRLTRILCPTPPWLPPNRPWDLSASRAKEQQRHCWR